MAKLSAHGREELARVTTLSPHESGEWRQEKVFMTDGRRLVKDTLIYKDGTKLNWGWKLLAKAKPMPLVEWLLAHKAQRLPSGWQRSYTIA